MTSENISVFALVLVVAECAALVWIIYTLKAETRAQASWRSTYENAVRSLRVRLDSVEKQSPTELAVQVVELRDAVARLAKTQQRFQGRFDQYMAPEARPDNSPPTLDRDALRREHASSIMPVGTRK